MLLRLGFFILKKGGLDTMAVAVIYASLIISKDITYKEVPIRIKEKVKTVLTSLGCEELAAD